MALNKIKSLFLKTAYKLADFYTNISFKAVIPNQFNDMEEIFKLVDSPNYFFSIISDKKSLHCFIISLSRLYSESFGLSAPNVKFSASKFFGEDNINGFALKNIIYLNPKYYDDCKKLSKSNNEEEKLKFIFNICKTTVHETTHIMQNILTDNIITYGKLTELKGDKNVGNFIIFSAYINALTNCVIKLYKSPDKNLMSINKFFILDDILSIYLSADTTLDKLNQQSYKNYGNSPEECVARLSALNFLEKIQKRQSKYTKLLHSERFEDLEWITSGNSDLINLFTVCNNYISLNQINSYLLYDENTNKEINLMKKILLDLKDFCAKNEKFKNIYELITLAEIKNLYSNFSVDIKKAQLNSGEISEKEFNDYIKEKKIYEEKKNKTRDEGNAIYFK